MPIDLVPDTLPDKLSDLLELAVNDAMAIEAANDPMVQLNMFTWVSGPLFNGSCEVCMAGAVMYKTLKITEECDLSEPELALIKKKLITIDSMRTGDKYGYNGRIYDLRISEEATHVFSYIYDKYGDVSPADKNKIGRLPCDVYKEAVKMLRELEAASNEPLVNWKK